MTFEPKTHDQLAEETAALRAEWPEGLPPRFSASAMGMLIRCPEQYRQRYVLGLKRPPRSALIWGRADHAAISDHFQRQIDTGEGLSVVEVAERFVEHFDMEVEDNGGLTEIPWFGSTSGGYQAASKEAGRIKDAGAQLACIYREDVAPYVQPLAVEVEIEVVSPLWPIPVVGYVDVEETHNLIERKTANRKNTTPNPDWQWQGRIYQLGKPGKALTWHQSVKNEKNPERQSAGVLAAQEFDATMNMRTEMMVGQAMKAVEHYFSTYGPEAMWPGNGVVHPWACNFCGYREDCPWWMS